ncbi:RNA polymerase sigma factor [Chitinophaga sp. GCM10012297]|uniref:Sigma-70 family RNA polymerase sigma factor n=1 Tax=Chitinophaga chungangae TaxID=2821488 RepID=A0ABS3YKJ0_9BACT|nr:sigma-70 family RNA polymerase sigma factor [Chitinophaga chungangae]MBO9155207.1 sigma-70 family RNA polymerase sigma factor [Chitinophaga chungangae]
MIPDPDKLADKQLVHRALSGDAQAFGIIIGNTEKLVAQIVCRMVSNVEDRKDLAQEIYLKAYRSLGLFKHGSKLSTWIAQISYNACMDYLRRKKLFYPGEPVDGPGQTTADGQMYRKELAGILQAGMEKLQPVYRTMLTLYHQEELSYGEIGEITGMPEGTVKNYLFRARKALKERLSWYYGEKEMKPRGDDGDG